MSMKGYGRLIRGFGDLTIWRFVNLSIWQFGDLAICRFVDLVIALANN